LEGAGDITRLIDNLKRQGVEPEIFAAAVAAAKVRVED